MAEDTQDRDVSERVRLRLSISPSLDAMLQETAEALGIHPTTVATFAFSIGLRAIRPMVIPASIPGLGKFIDQASTTQLQEAVSETGIPVRK